MICIAVVSLVFIIAPNSIWMMIVSLPVLIVIPGYYLYILILNKWAFDVLEKALISFGLSGATSFFVYLIFKMIDAGSLYVLTYFSMAVLCAALVCLAILTKKNGSPESPLGKLKTLPKAWLHLTIYDKALSIMTVLVVALLLFSGFTVLSEPRSEKFSEFYILNEEGKAYDIPHNFTTGIEENVILGIANHEGRQVKYNIEIWLVNYTNKNMSITVHEMYFINSLNVTLNSVSIDLNDPYRPQFEQMVGLNLTHPGKMKLLFLLHQDPQPITKFSWNQNDNYATNVTATNRVISVINKEIQYLQLNIDVKAAHTILEVNGQTGIFSEQTLAFIAGVPQDVEVRISNQEGVNKKYILEVWLVNYTNVNMAVHVTQMYFISSSEIILPFETTTVENHTYHELTINVTPNLTGNYSLFFLLYQGYTDEIPESPLLNDENYAFTSASWRIVRCVNHEIQFFEQYVTVVA